MRENHQEKMKVKNKSSTLTSNHEADTTSVTFAHRLAHPDTTIRHQNLNIFHQYIHQAQSKMLTPLSLSKLWKALFYCYWLCDKRIVQHDVSVRLSRMQIGLDNKRWIDFTTAFWMTMQREWSGIDKLRLDKFMTLIRHFLYHSFLYLSHYKWNHDLITQMIVIYSNGFLKNCQECRGLFLFTTSIYAEEIAHVSETSTLTPQALLTLISPYYTILSSCIDITMVKRAEELFSNLLKYTKSKDEKDDKMKALVVASAKDIADHFGEIAASKNTIEKYRKSLYKFQSLFHHIYTSLHLQSNTLNTLPQKVKNKKSVSGLLEAANNDYNDTNKKKKRGRDEELSNTIKKVKISTFDNKNGDESNGNGVFAAAEDYDIKEEESGVELDGDEIENEDDDDEDGNDIDAVFAAAGQDSDDELVNIEREQKRRKNLMELTEEDFAAENEDDDDCDDLDSEAEAELEAQLEAELKADLEEEEKEDKTKPIKEKNRMKNLSTSNLVQQFERNNPKKISKDLIDEKKILDDEEQSEKEFDEKKEEDSPVSMDDDSLFLNAAAFDDVMVKKAVKKIRENKRKKKNEKEPASAQAKPIFRQEPVNNSVFNLKKNKSKKLKQHESKLNPTSTSNHNQLFTPVVSIEDNPATPTKRKRTKTSSATKTPTSFPSVITTNTSSEIYNSDTVIEQPTYTPTPIIQSTSSAEFIVSTPLQVKRQRKSVRISLDRNQIQEFDRFIPVDVTDKEGTLDLLLKPSPRSAIKAESIVYMKQLQSEREQLKKKRLSGTVRNGRVELSAHRYVIHRSEF